MTFDRSRPLYRYFAEPDEGGPGWYEVGADNLPFHTRVSTHVESALRAFVPTRPWSDAFLKAVQQHRKATIYHGIDTPELAEVIRRRLVIDKKAALKLRFMPHFYYADNTPEAPEESQRTGTPAEDVAYGYEIIGADGETKHVLDATRDELLLAIVNLTDCMEAVRGVGKRIQQIDRSYTTGDALEDDLSKED